MIWYSSLILKLVQWYRCTCAFTKILTAHCWQFQFQVFGRRSVFLTCSKLWHYAHALFQLPQQQYIIIFLTHISFRIAVFSVSSLFATPYLLSSFVFYFYFYYYCFFDGFICSIWCERAACNHTHKTHAHECMRIDVQFFDCLVLELHIFFGFPYHLI